MTGAWQCNRGGLACRRDNLQQPGTLMCFGCINPRASKIELAIPPTANENIPERVAALADLIDTPPLSRR